MKGPVYLGVEVGGRKAELVGLVRFSSVHSYFLLGIVIIIATVNVVRATNCAIDHVALFIEFN